MKRTSLTLGVIVTLSLLLPNAAAADETATFTYDELGRLVKANACGTVTGGQSVALAFDATTNRSSYSVAGVPSGGVALAICDATAAESGTMVFRVTRLGSSAAAAAASYATSNVTAAAGTNYTAASGTVSFAIGEVSKVINVTTINDGVKSSSMTMTMTLSAPTNGATLSRAAGTGTINNINP